MCMGCASSWLGKNAGQNKESTCPLCRSPCKLTDCHASTFLRRKINSLKAYCEFKCGEVVELGQYENHRSESCTYIRAMTVIQLYAINNTDVTMAAVQTARQLLQHAPIKLVIHIVDRIHIDRCDLIEKSELLDALVKFAETNRKTIQKQKDRRQQQQQQQYASFEASKQANTGNTTLYDAWSVKELKLALQSANVDTSNMLERSELLYAARQANITQKPASKKAQSTSSQQQTTPPPPPRQRTSSQSQQTAGTRPIRQRTESGSQQQQQHQQTPHAAPNPATDPQGFQNFMNETMSNMQQTINSAMEGMSSSINSINVGDNMRPNHGTSTNGQPPENCSIV